MQIRDAIVIGAGLAGLSAARRLKDQGASVLVLEARSRVGGRVFSERAELNSFLARGSTLDLGAQFIGDAHHRMSALVEEFGLTRLPRYRGGLDTYIPWPGAKPVVVRNEALPLSLPAKLDALQMHWRVARQIRKFARERNHPVRETTASGFLRSMAFSDEAYRFVTGFIEAELCMPTDTVSVHELLEQSAAVGGRDGEAASAGWFLAEGTGAIAQYLAAQIAPSVILDSPVQRIHQDPATVTVETTNSSFRARSVIIAVPPQLYGSIGLVSLMPEHRARVIAGYQPGTVVKTILVFETPWWRDQGLSGFVLSPGGPCNAVMDGSHPGSGMGMLILFSTAQSGIQLGQTIAEADRIALLCDWLCSVTGVAVPKPLHARSIDWSADAWSLGGYASRRGLGGWAEAPDLFEPVGNIHFAGTETATEWRSFMEGALQSAERAAQAVAALHGG